MAKFLGQSDNLLLFSDESADSGNAVVVNSSVSVVVASGSREKLEASRSWSDGEYSEYDEEAATAAFSSMSGKQADDDSRRYTIPLGAKRAAALGLERFSESNKGTTPGGVAIAQKLITEDQVSLRELSYMQTAADYASEDSTQTLLFGGRAAGKWVSSITDTSGLLLASAADLEDFEDILARDPDAAPEFIARLYLDGSGIDRLYRVDLDKQSYVWDGTVWTNLGIEDGSIWEYDAFLDGDQSFEVTHILIDAESAIRAAGWFAGDAWAKISVDDLDPEEAHLVRDAIEDEDWDAVDRVITAAGAVGDGVYTSEERSENVQSQPRDSKGLFSKTGTRVMVNGNSSMTGKVARIDKSTGTVEVELESGGTVTVPSKSTTTVSEYTPTAEGTAPEVPRVDFSGILAEPRTPVNRMIAQIPSTLPRLDSTSLSRMIDSYPAWVQEQRLAPENTTYTDEHPLISGWVPRKSVTAAGVPATDSMSPETADVQPVYLAIVSEDDPRAVFKLISVVPAGAHSNQPMTYARENGAWVRDEQMITLLSSLTPPPVIPLDSDLLNDVLKQVDDSQGENIEEDAAPEFIDEAAQPITASLVDPIMVLWGPRPENMRAAIVAAGGLDRNRGGADKLRRYWTKGPGAAKIRWGTPGDWTRCVRQLTKYMGPRSRGYCALRHKEVTGMWTGDRKNRQDFSVNAAGRTFSTTVLRSSQEILQNAAMSTRALVASARFRGEDVDKYQIFAYDENNQLSENALVAAGQMQILEGGKFFIPLALPEGIESGDGRIVEKNAASIRTLPIALLWQIALGEGHSGAVVVGKIERLGRTPAGIGGGYGTFDTGFYGQEAERMVRGEFLRFVSADMVNFEAEEMADESDDDTDGKIAKKRMLIKKARVAAVTIVSKPAFEEATILSIPEVVVKEEDVIPDGIYVDGNDPFEEASLVASAYVAESIPVAPPKQWFGDPGLSGPTPLTIDDDGRVFGHIASWDTGHLNPALNGVRPPRSRSNYGYFRTGMLRTEEGSDVPVGQLTLAGGHAGMQASAREAVKHYDDTASAFADVAAGEDQHGIWVAGSLRPGITAEQVRRARASAPSGDWRTIRGNLELVAVCQVNVPGFPIARAMVASGHTQAIVAAGAMPLAKLKGDPMAELQARLERLEQATNRDYALQASALADRVRPFIEKRDAELAARKEAVFSRVAEFGVISAEGRKAAADKGEALPDGSFPIRNEADLKKAIKAFGRAGNKAAAKKHITKRAKALGKTDLLPENWSTASSDAVTASLENMRSTLSSLQAAATRGEERELREELEKRGIISEDQGKYTPDTQPRDHDGQFRDVLARIRDDLGVSGNQAVISKLRETEDYAGVGDYATAARSALALKDMLDRLDSGALNDEAIQNVRNTTEALSTAIANIPLPSDNQAAKLRFSDLPPALRDLIDDLITRVETKMGEDSGEVLDAVKAFKSGSDVYSQSEINEHLNRMLRIAN